MNHWTSTFTKHVELKIERLSELTMAILGIPTFHSPAFFHYLKQYDSQPNAQRESHTSYLNYVPSWMSILLGFMERVEDISTDRDAGEEL